MISILLNLSGNLADGWGRSQQVQATRDLSSRLPLVHCVKTDLVLSAARGNMGEDIDSSDKTRQVDAFVAERESAVQSVHHWLLMRVICAK